MARWSGLWHDAARQSRRAARHARDCLEAPPARRTAAEHRGDRQVAGSSRDGSQQVMLVSGLIYSFWILVAQVSSSPTVPDDLAAAKSLYASANYEEALTRLSSADPAGSTDEIDQYRALCQLALGRTTDAQRSLEQLVARRPLFKMSDADVSPRLVAIFHDVRKRLLPAAARRIYARAKTDFEERSYAAAAAQFKELLGLLADEDLAGDAAALGDLKLLGEGFLRLAEVEVAAAAKA